MKFSIALAVLVSFALLPQQQESADDGFRNQFDQSSMQINLLANPEVMKELELSDEQRGKMHMARHKMQMLIHRYHQDGANEQDPELKQMLQKRLFRDIGKAQQEVTTDLLLPHQNEHLNRIRNRRILEHHVATGFTRTKGTELEKLELTDLQRGKLNDARDKLHSELEAERKRHVEKIGEIKERALASVRKSLNDEQLEMLNIEEKKE